MLEENTMELEMTLSMFTDEVVQHPTDKATLIVSLPYRFVLHITIPPHDYPNAVYPSLFVEFGPNAQLVSLFSIQLSRTMRDDVPLGMPMLLPIITLAQGLVVEMMSAREAEAREAQEQEGAKRAEEGQERLALEQSAVEVWAGTPISDRKSKFLAHMARVDSVERVRQVVEHLRSQKHIAEAIHPSIYAYRFTDASGLLHKDCDDDGEAGASVKIMFLLDQMQIDGYVIVVTRWFGGILLGPDRFKHIMEVSKNMLLTIPQRESERQNSGSEKGGKCPTKRNDE